MSIVQTLRKDNAQYGYWQAGDRVLLAISGGVDSMALLHAMQQLPPPERPNMTVLHVHHHLREEANQDCQLVVDYCHAHGLDLEVKHWRDHPDSNIEAAARKFRYAFFKEQMAAKNSTILLTAHHADDQMETILMRLTRGSTLNGYAGIQRIRPLGNGSLIRPLLAFEKKSLYDYCQQYAVPFCEDATNQELTYTRNRFRHQIVPLIKGENTQAARHFAEFSSDLTDLAEVAMPLIEQTSTRIFTPKEGEWELDRADFLMQGEAMRRLVISHFLTAHWQGAAQRQHVQQIIDLIVGHQPQATIDLPGGIVRRRYDRIAFVLLEKTKLNKLQFKKELSLNKWLQLPFNGKIGLFLPSVKAPSNPPLGYLRQEEVSLPLVIRNWQPGDTIQMNKKQPFTKKVARIFIDKKIPLEARDQAWVVADQAGKLLLVPGYASSIWVHDSGDYALSIININEVQDDVTSRY